MKQVCSLYRSHWSKSIKNSTIFSLNSVTSYAMDVKTTKQIIGTQATDLKRAPSSASGRKVYEYIDVSIRDNADVIRLNRPEKLNAFAPQMWVDLLEIITETAKSDRTVTVLTGTGNYFTSGADFLTAATSDKAKSSYRVKYIIDVLIDYPKPLLAVVNGPVIGIGVTLLGLFDGVFATEKATFQTPFTRLGISPEGCSSFTFPLIMGPTLAADILIFGNKITAAEAHRRNLVTKMYPDHLFEKEVWPEIARIAALPKGSVCDSKRIIRDTYKQVLHDINEKETVLLIKRRSTDEHKSAVQAFRDSKKSKM